MAGSPAAESLSSPPDVRKALEDACAREADVTAAFTIASEAGRTPPVPAITARGRIVGVTGEAITLTTDSAPAVDPQAAGQCWATVAIHVGSHELVFFASLVSVIAGAAGGSTTVTLKLPSEIIATRRRRSFRSPATAKDGIQLKLWRIQEHAFLNDRPRASQGFACELHEISVDGFGATLHARQIEAMRLVAGQRFRVELATSEAEMIFEARLIHPAASARDDASVRCGFAIVARENEIEYRRNRQQLEAAIAKLQQQAASARKSA